MLKQSVKTPLAHTRKHMHAVIAQVIFLPDHTRSTVSRALLAH